MRKLGFLLGVFIIAFVAVKLNAITVNPASAVTADSAATALTIPYRDSNGDFAAGTITATIAGNITGGVTTVASTVKVSSSATSAFSLSVDGAYTTEQLQAKTPARAGMLVFNSTLLEVCVSTGATVEGYARLKDASTCE